ncbi:hypothetical protein HGRIS_004275 [Hohenbuehelia grisea]|uniref:Uncharacterized protein n=1 Tax=Hohenbuehelia grisea TaxID=104357 RepID=A0ABR3IPA7_9AGAR
MSDAGLPQDESIFASLSNADDGSGSDSSEAAHSNFCRTLALSVSKALNERLTSLNNKFSSSAPPSPFEKESEKAFATIAEFRFLFPQTSSPA